jgi:hypothetical protein
MSKIEILPMTKESALLVAELGRRFAELGRLENRW